MGLHNRTSADNSSGYSGLPCDEADEDVDKCCKKQQEGRSLSWSFIVILSTFSALWFCLFFVWKQAIDSRTSTSVVTYPNTNEPNDSGRPVFALHIGPPKTATTYLQYSLTEYRDVLKRDNYQYLGQVMDHPNDMFNHRHGPMLKILKDKKCMTAVNRARVRHLDYPRCWEKLGEMLQHHRQRNESILLSEEKFAIKYSDLINLERTSVDWKALADLLQEQDWEPLILIGYRRFGEILPSAKQQWDQELVHSWKNPAPQAIYPQILEDPRLGINSYYPQSHDDSDERIRWSYTDHLVKTISPYLPIRLLNVHQQHLPDMDLRSCFLCHVLPYAPNACAQSMADSLKEDKTPRNPHASLFYDALAMAAADRGWIVDKKRVKRAEAGDALQLAGPSVSKAFVLNCPSPQELQPVLDASLEKEVAIWGADRAKQWKRDHVTSFQQHLKDFCWIDTEATLDKIQPLFEDGQFRRLLQLVRRKQRESELLEGERKHSI